jgi:SAM-dependent methyltransferase
MPYPADHFDVVYGHSVFTHLSYEDHFNWLIEIRRVLKPGGFAFLTVCTEPGVYVTRYNDVTRNGEFLARYLEDGFYDFEVQNVGVDAGREGYYRLVAHTRGFILKNWSGHFTVRRILPCYMEHQDLVILQKPANQ